MSSNPLFSVLIANYNDGKYLLTTIKSILAQSYQNLEIIIVDDCSTDNSIDVINHFDDSRIRLYQNDKNYGCGYTKRKCVELANGEICGFVDADDSIVVNALEIMVEAHANHPECSMIYSKFYYTDENLTILSTSEHQCAIPDGESFLTCKRQGAISHFVTFKKDFYQETEGVNSSMRIAEDIDLYFKLEEVGKTLFIPEPLYYYRTFTGNNTSLGKEKIGKAAGWEVIARYAACKRRGLPAELFSFFGLEETISDLTDKAFKEGAESVRKSKSYRFGRALLHPFK
ncbi:MAG: glycosyltransferase [Bacteroidales bacterium]|nr:glycosyltransferase [Bacteroidales bacterium]